MTNEGEGHGQLGIFPSSHSGCSAFRFLFPRFPSERMTQYPPRHSRSAGNIPGPAAPTWIARCSAIRAISEKPEGYVINGTGEVVAYADKRVKDSPDGEYHWCAHQAGLDAGHTICLFVPPKGF